MIRPQTPMSILTTTGRTTLQALGITLLTALLPGTAAAQAKTDTILKKDGSRVRGVEIQALTLQGARWQRGAENGDVPAYHIQSIEWGSVPESFLSARAAMERGDYQTAMQLYGEAATQAGRPVLQAEAKFLQCRAATAAAAVDTSTAANAAGAARALIAESADSFRLPELLLLLGRALRHGGLGADAETTLKELDDRAVREGWSTVWSARAKYEIALAQLAQNKPGDARGSFQAAASAADAALGTPSPDDRELQELRANAKVGEGETYLAENQFGRAVDFYRGLATSSPELKAAAKAGEGQALFLQAKSQNNKVDDLRRAQIALAEAAVLDSIGGETSAKANYYQALCLLALGTEKEGDTFKNRATAYLQTVVRNYGSTRWAAAARAELSR